MERPKITCIMGRISSHNSFNRIGLSLTGPAAFPGLRFFKSFSMPVTEISKYFITGEDSCIPGGNASEGIPPQSAISRSFILHRRGDSGALVVKTDWNFKLCRSAFSAVSVTSLSL